VPYLPVHPPALLPGTQGDVDRNDRVYDKAYDKEDVLERITRNNSAICLIDHQVGLLLGVHDITVAELKHNSVGLAKAAKILGMPTIASTTAKDDLWGPTFPELVAVLDTKKYPIIDSHARCKRNGRRGRQPGCHEPAGQGRHRSVHRDRLRHGVQCSRPTFCNRSARAGHHQDRIRPIRENARRAVTGTEEPYLMPNSARPNNAESRPDARTDIVLAISKALADPSDAFAGLNNILDRGGYSEEDVRSTFESVDDLVVAIAEHEAFLPNTLDDARDSLIAFGLVAWREYSTTLVGFVRMMMAEGTRNPLLKKRVYEVGSAIVTLRLREFLSEANERGILSISDAQVYAEQLMGLLREPLYQALMLNPATSQKGTATDRVKASIERFLHGCGSARSATP
jgi:hypothetical protein